MNTEQLEASLANHIQDPRVKKMNALRNKIVSLNNEMNSDSIVNNAIKASLFKNHEKAPQMLKLLYKLHGSKNITKQGALNLVFGRLRSECGVEGHDGHFYLLQDDNT